MLKAILNDCLVEPKKGSYEILSQSIVRIKTFKGAIQDMNYMSTGFLAKLEYLDLYIKPELKVELKEKGMVPDTTLPAKVVPVEPPAPKLEAVEEDASGIKDKAGTVFDPEKHQITKTGKPRTVFGKFVKIQTK